jgi:signal transduction histidine kinase
MAERTSALTQRFVLVALLAVVLPMSIVGVWTTSAAARSGRVLLDAQLTRELEAITSEATTRLTAIRAELLAVGESEPLRAALVAAEQAAGAVPGSPFIRTALDRLDRLDAFQEIAILDRSDRVRLRHTDAGMTEERTRGTRRLSPGITVQQPLTDLLSGAAMGTARATIRVSALVPRVLQAAPPDAPLLALRTADGRLIPQSGSNAALFAGASVDWAGREWSVVSRAIPGTDVTLLLAGDLAPYQTPFTDTARRSTLALLVTAALGVLVVLVATRRITRSVERAFAQQEALASVGEFASELAHEVRNPLGAMRLDLQRAKELVDDPDEVALILPRALALVDRLDRAVSGALRVTRGRTAGAELVVLGGVIERAATSAGHEFTRRAAQLSLDRASGEVRVRGDADALEQLVLNLLLNAAHSLTSGGRATVSVRQESSTVRLCITDTGTGMTAEQLAMLEQPYHSSRRDGTGLGIKIARRIAQHHGGELRFESTVGIGTIAEVRLPLAQGR